MVHLLTPFAEHEYRQVLRVAQERCYRGSTMLLPSEFRAVDLTSSCPHTLLKPGIGTYFQPGVVSPLFQWGAKILDEAFAW